MVLIATRRGQGGCVSKFNMPIAGVAVHPLGLISILLNTYLFDPPHRKCFHGNLGTCVSSSRQQLHYSYMLVCKKSCTA